MDSKVAQNRSESEDKIRLQIELEFVQCLANPNYLNFLAQRGYFNDKSFINYLNYLQYWKRPEYAKFIKYPMCLHFLDLLQHEHFRRELTSTQCAKFIDDQILLHWHHYARKRTKLFQTVQQNKQQSNSNQGQIGSNQNLTNNNIGSLNNSTSMQQQQHSIATNNNSSPLLINGHHK